jgi:beta-glucanase (GH16 family)
LYGTAHWYNEKHISSGGTIPCDVSQYHVYAVERSTDSIRWLVDNNRYFAIGIKDGENSTQEFHEPFYIMLNLAIGGDWPKDPDSTSVFPDTVFVDYVRVYKELPK